jgi:hypothetical protein
VFVHEHDAARDLPAWVPFPRIARKRAMLAGDDTGAGLGKACHMSQALSSKAPVSPGLPFEQALYQRSPFGLLATTALVFALLFGSFAAVSAAEGAEAVHLVGRFIRVTDFAWSALVLSLLCCAALMMQRYARLAEARDAGDYARILTGGLASARELTAVVASEARFGRSTLIGLGVGIGLSILIRWSEIGEGHRVPLGILLWYASATTLLSILFARGVEQTRAGNRGYARTLNAELKIDLLRTDLLAVLGRSAARSALIWFTISAIACLFFVGGDLNWLTILLALACAAMGMGHFAGVMGRIHRQIVTAKKAELEDIRCRIDVLRTTLHEDAFASAKLHGLLAYEKRVSEAPEWPFDQTTAVRVGASALILTVPWFGQAVAAYLVEHLGHIGG